MKEPKFGMAGLGSNENLSEITYPKFSLKNRKLWSNYVDILNESHQLNIVRFTAQWARQMEAGIEKGGKLEDIAKVESDRAEQKTGIYPAPIATAVEILCEVWTHGPELISWYSASSKKKKSSMR